MKKIAEIELSQEQYEALEKLSINTNERMDNCSHTVNRELGYVGETFLTIQKFRIFDEGEEISTTYTLYFDQFS